MQNDAIYSTINSVHDKNQSCRCLEMYFDIV